MSMLFVSRCNIIADREHTKNEASGYLDERY